MACTVASPCTCTSSSPCALTATGASSFPNVLVSTVGAAPSGTVPTYGSAGGPSAWTISPYVDLAASYGAGYSVSGATGAITAPASSTLVISPVAAACVGCHDSGPAVDHMQANGGRFYDTRANTFASGATLEQWVLCHGWGGLAAIKDMHPVGPRLTAASGRALRGPPLFICPGVGSGAGGDPRPAVTFTAVRVAPGPLRCRPVKLRRVLPLIIGFVFVPAALMLAVGILILVYGSVARDYLFGAPHRGARRRPPSPAPPRPSRSSTARRASRSSRPTS